jgi:hypothetical protein
MFIAPEVLTCANVDRLRYGKEVDMWSFGIIMFILLTGEIPVDVDDPKTMFDQIMNSKFDYSLRLWGSLSHESIKFVQQCLQVNPQHRLTPQGGLEHPWMFTNLTAIRLSAPVVLQDSSDREEATFEDDINRSSRDLSVPLHLKRYLLSKSSRYISNRSLHAQFNPDSLSDGSEIFSMSDRASPSVFLTSASAPVGPSFLSPASYAISNPPSPLPPPMPAPPLADPLPPDNGSDNLNSRPRSNSLTTFSTIRFRERIKSVIQRNVNRRFSKLEEGCERDSSSPAQVLQQQQTEQSENPKVMIGHSGSLQYIINAIDDVDVLADDGFVLDDPHRDMSRDDKRMSSGEVLAEGACVNEDNLCEGWLTSAPDNQRFWFVIFDGWLEKHNNPVSSTLQIFFFPFKKYMPEGNLNMRVCLFVCLCFACHNRL